MKRRILTVGITLLLAMTFSPAFTRAVGASADGFPVTRTLAATPSDPLYVICELDELKAYVTGETKSDSGKVLKLYKCPRWHGIWVVSHP